MNMWCAVLLLCLELWVGLGSHFDEMCEACVTSDML
jgi:hypothetical protein